MFMWYFIYRKFVFQKAFLNFCIFLCLFFPVFGSGFTREDIDGVLRIRSSVSQNQIKEFSSLMTKGRLRLKGVFRPSNKFKTQIHFISYALYGTNLSFEKSLKIYPSVSWFLTENLEFKLGRNLYENKFRQIAAVNDYKYSFDGFFLEYSTQVLDVNFWGAYLPETNWGFEAIPGLKYGFGFFLDIKSVSDYVDYFNVHVAYLGDSFFREESQTISRYGLALEGAINQIDLAYRLVAIGHGKGIQFKLEDNMYHFHLSYARPELFDSKIFIGYHTDSAKYDPWLYHRRENAGRLNLFFWGNLSYYFFSLSASLDPLFDVKLSFYDFKSTEEGLINKGLDNFFPSNHQLFSNTERRVLGKELDVLFQKEINDDFGVHFLVGFFIPSVENEKLFTWKNLYNKFQLASYYKF